MLAGVKRGQSPGYLLLALGSIVRARGLELEKPEGHFSVLVMFLLHSSLVVFLGKGAPVLRFSAEAAGAFACPTPWGQPLWRDGWGLSPGRSHQEQPPLPRAACLNPLALGMALGMGSPLPVA